jgi:hypothetical protein
MQQFLNRCSEDASLIVGQVEKDKSYPKIQEEFAF